MAEVPRMDEHGDPSLRSFAQLIRRRRRIVFTVAFGLPLLAAVVLLFIPNTYTATGRILVESPQGGFGGDFFSQISAMTGITAQVAPTEMYLAILRSENVAMAVSDHLNLTTHLKVRGKTREERVETTLQIMAKRIEFDNPDPVSITITATDRSRDMAAAIVNTYLGALETASETLAVSRARRTRIRVENALADTRAGLDSTRTRLEEFQQKYGVFSVEKQTEGALTLIGNLQAELLATQTERDAMASYTSSGSGRLRGLDSRIAALEGQIRSLVGELQSESAASAHPAVKPLTGSSGGSFLIPLNEIPRLGGEYAHILIDLKVQETKYSLLAAQYEQSKVEESESVPAFETLDRARVPHRKSGPHRILLVLAAMVGGALAGILLAVFLDDLDRRVDSETRQDLNAALPSFIRRLLRLPAARGSAG